MTIRQSAWTTTLAVTILGGIGTAFGDGVHIGRSAGGTLMVDVESVFTYPILLLPIAPGGLFVGWSGINPGFTDTLDADVDPDILPLEPGSQIFLEVIHFDPAMVVIDGAFQTLVNPGDSSFVGDSGFDTHPLYLVDMNDPQFDSQQSVWEATFLLRDEGTTGYAPSGPVTLRFIIHPLPSDFNEDGLVNTTDYTALESCLAAPNTLPVNACTFADIDRDQDVDLADFAILQNTFSGG